MWLHHSYDFMRLACFGLSYQEMNLHCQIILPGIE